MKTEIISQRDNILRGGHLFPCEPVMDPQPEVEELERVLAGK